MPPSLEALLADVAARDPDRAAYMRWVRPNLGDAAVERMATEFLAAPFAPRGLSPSDPRSWRSPNETLLDMDDWADPDEPTAQFEAFSDAALDISED